MSKSFYHFECTPYTWNKVGDLYQIDNEFKITMDDKELKYIITILPGFRTDGGSIPWAFRWFAKKWKEDDYRYNACFILHDAMYCSEYVHRSIADDMLRSSLRDVGLDRFHASTICFCVNNFASGHYGKDKDEDDNYDFVRFNICTI